MYLAKGVLATTAIEGNTLSEEQVLKHIQGELKHPPSQSYLAQEIDNILRGQNLTRGVTQAFRTVAPKAFAKEKDAETLAKHLLKLPNLSDQAFRCWTTATAVRSKELFSTLVQIAKGTDGTESDIAIKAKMLLAELGIVDDKLAIQLDEVLTATQKAVATVPGNEKLVADLTRARNFAVTSAERAITDSINRTNGARDRFNFWFEATQDRAQQWFAAQTRAWTIALAIPAAAFFQLDAVEIYSRISTDSTLRNKLVAAAGSFTVDAEKALADSTTVLQDAFRDWQNSPEVQKASLGQDEKEALANLAPQPTETRASFLARLHQILAASQEGSDLGKLFVAKLDGHAEDRLKNEAQDFTKVSADLENTGFQLLTKPFNRWYPADYVTGLSEHCLGILISAALLSLGAPFWFNILKSLTNLRSLVAHKIGNEEDTAPDATARPNTKLPVH